MYDFCENQNKKTKTLPISHSQRAHSEILNRYLDSKDANYCSKIKRWKSEARRNTANFNKIFYINFIRFYSPKINNPSYCACVWAFSVVSLRQLMQAHVQLGKWTKAFFDLVRKKERESACLARFCLRLSCVMNRRARKRGG